MKRLFYSILLSVLILSSSLTVSAFDKPSSKPAPSSSSGGGGGESSGGGGGSTTAPATPEPDPAASAGHMDGSVGPYGVDIDVGYPFSVYTPKVTYLKSINAALANEDGKPIYFMPKLEDFPTDLTNVVSDLTDGNKVQHKFAAVYGGYFDTDVVLSLASPVGSNNAKMRTSKKVYSSEDNSRLLTLVGYDLLLQQEEFVVKVENGRILAEYNPTRVTKNNLRADVCIMDLYKAIGVEEWDIEFAYGVDNDLDVEQSPILQLLPVMTSGEKNKGYDTSESIVWVAATRTNPEQYWKRCLQDAIFDGGLHNITAEKDSYIGSETSVSFSATEGQLLTLGQFCAITRAIMTLYGEPVLTPQQEELCLLNYGTIIPQNSYTEEIRDSIIYLSAKGIIDPTQKNFTSFVKFKDIEDILLRVADEGSRLTLPNKQPSVLAQEGYTSIDTLSVSTTGGSFDIIDANDLMYNDFLIEINNETTYRMSRSTQGTGIESSGAVVTYQTIAKKDDPNLGEESAGSTDAKAKSIENIAIWYKGEKKKPEEGIWQIVGIESYTIGGKHRDFYHFKINTDEVKSLSFTDTDISKEKPLPGTEFDLPYHTGGIYYKKDGAWIYTDFSTQGFDDTYRDESSNVFNAGYSKLKSSNAQLMGFYFDGSVADTAFRLATANPTYDFRGLYKSNTHTLLTGKRIDISPSLRAIIFEPSNSSATNSNYYRMELYGTNLNQVLQTSFISTLMNGADASDESDIAFYRAEDNTLLISVNYLIKTQKVISFEDVGDNVYIMGVRSVIGRKSIDTNVVIYDKDSKGFIMVGDTMFPKNNETLLEMVGAEYYINAKALTGWASDMVLIPTGSAKECMAIDATLYNRNSANLMNNVDDLSTSGITTSVHTLTTAAQNKVAVLNRVNVKTRNVRDAAPFNGKGLMLTSAYSLSNYCMVMADDNGLDYLFVYHIKGQADSGLEDDSVARNRFAELTGFSIEPDPNYYMVMYALERNEYDDIFSGNRTAIGVDESAKQLHYVHCELRGKSIGEQDITWGWTYSPTITDDVVKAAKKYAECNSHYILPFVYAYGKIYDVNLNVCKASPTASKLEPVGTLPAYMFGSAAQKIGKIGTDGGVTYSDVPSGNVFSDYEITAAPVGSFALFKASVDSTIKEVNAASLYWGTTKIEYDSRFDKVKISGRPIYLKTDTAVTRVFAGAALNSVYAVKTSQANVTSFISTAADALETVMNRAADSLVDWDKYTFNRLISNLDSWSSIVLIFCLNILPRVCILLFFALMLLSLIKDIRFWKAFCNNTFDIYKFLTFGHISVETINLRRTVWTSMICLILFYMIMDGALFNFILWLCEFLLAVMQR